MGPLERMLVGCPFSERHQGIDPDAAKLETTLRELVDFLENEHGAASRGFVQAKTEILTLLDYEADVDSSTACKRAVLMFALWRDPAFGDRFEESDGAFLARLRRHLPIACPPFLANLAQAPDALVALCVVLAQLWGDNTLCFPREDAPGAHLKGTVGHDQHGAN